MSRYVYINAYYCIQGNIRLDLFSFLLPLLSVGDFKTEQLNSNVSNHFSLNKTVFGRIQDGSNLFASVQGQKLREAKITLNTVLYF